MKSPTLLGFSVFIYALAWTWAYKLDELAREAEMELDNIAMKKMEMGGRSSLSRKRKFTKESLAMQGRNEMFNTIKNKLKRAGETEEDSVALARSALSFTSSSGNLKPAGQGKFTKNVLLVDNICKGVKPECSSSDKYRTIDGTCNNPTDGKEYVGSMSTPFRRDADAVAYDIKAIPVKLVPIYYVFPGIRHKECKKTPGRPTALPSPRLVSTSIHKDTDVSDSTVTHMLTQFGQFLDHDLTLSPELITGTEEECCSSEPPEACLPIKVPRNDPFYSKLREPVRCLPFFRSVLFCEDAVPVKREQVNALTSFLDASNVYGSDEERASRLRTHENGLLKTSHNNLLPLIDDVFSGGDERAREMPGLAAMHTLWLREHNRLARHIRGEKEHWDDETIYQEARRILVAQMQNVVYKEFLPALLGNVFTDHPENGLDLPLSGTSYDPHLNPSISNEFATAAFRFGHSMIQGFINANFPESGSFIKSYQLHPNFFNDENYVLEDGGGMEKLLMGLAKQPAQKFDTSVTQETTNFLFAEEGSDHGEDLVARNIQRSRDHALAPYLTYYEKFGNPGKHIECWSQRPPEIHEDLWKDLMMLYMLPTDIDLFTGGHVETPSGDSLLGPTFQRMIGDQFARLRDGDRFFFTHNNEVNSFTEDQRKAIIGRSLSDIMCDNTKIVHLQKNVFRLTHPDGNPVVPCANRDPFDVSQFLESRGQDCFKNFKLVGDLHVESKI